MQVKVRAAARAVNDALQEAIRDNRFNGTTASDHLEMGV
jgi:hypothetical protein